MPEKRILSLDSQVLNNWQACGAKLNYMMIEHLRPVKKAEALERGDLVHIMLKTYYRIKKAKCEFKWKESYTNESWRASCLIVGQWHATKLDLPNEECSAIIKSFNEYFDYKLNDGWVPLAVEETAIKTLFEDEFFQFIYTGNIDLILQWRTIDPPILAVDHKSSSRFQPITSLSNQFYGYNWLLGTKRILVNRFGLQKSLKPKEKFVPEILSYTEELIEEWKEDSIEEIKEMIMFIEKGKFRRNLTSCDKYSGCIFQPLCTTDRRARDFKKRQLFKIGEKWEPLKLGNEDLIFDL